LKNKYVFHKNKTLPMDVEWVVRRAPPYLYLDQEQQCHCRPAVATENGFLVLGLFG
jgi:hypothetical protein